MPIDHASLSSLRKRTGFASAGSITVHGVEFDIPVSTPGVRSWQRRVLPDLVPDYPLADASEKILYDIERTLTVPEQSEKTVPEALAGAMSPLVPLFYAQTTLKTGVPVAFHVTAVKTPERLKCRTLKEHTLLLLCRDEEGRLDESLLTEFLERFRSGKNEMDLAQRAFVDAVSPSYDRETHALPTLDGHRKAARPFLPLQGALFRRDLRTLLDVPYVASEFFRISNLLIAVHFGLFQPRLALALNPSIRALLDEMSEPNSVDVGALEAVEQGQHPSSDFTGWLQIRAPDLGETRPLSTTAPERESYREMQKQLAELHFSLLLLNRARELTRAYLMSRGWSDGSAIDEACQYPSQLINRLRTDGEYRRFFDLASAALAVRFASDQLNPDQQTAGARAIDEAPSGLAGLRELYILHNIQPPAKPWKTRAVKSGIEVTDGVLARGEYGIISNRNRVGKYFELGTGLLPLLLLLVIGSEKSKASVYDWWEGLERYGFSFAPAERALLLRRLQSMGLYERFSDAGEANYIYNLMIPERSK